MIILSGKTEMLQIAIVDPDSLRIEKPKRPPGRKDSFYDNPLWDR